MRILFVVQGEGRGHMTQAIAISELLRRHGHQVCAVIAGQNSYRQIPAFFREAIDAPLHTVTSPTFVVKAEKSVRPIHSLLYNLIRLPTYLRELRRLKRRMVSYQPDAIFNFFEPMCGLLACFSKLPAPVIAIAHQFMFLHPAYQFPKGRLLERLATKAFTRFVGTGASQLAALSLYDAADTHRITVLPPLLRPEVFDLTSEDSGFVLVYLLNRGYAQEIIQWHHHSPHRLPVHCFVDLGNESPPEQTHDGVTLHHLDGAKFLSMMAKAQAVVCTAGFESVSEAALFGKPLGLVPVQGHYEQWLNAQDAERAGIAIWLGSFNLDPVVTQAKNGEQSRAFRDWVEQGEQRFLKMLGDFPPA